MRKLCLFLLLSSLCFLTTKLFATSKPTVHEYHLKNGLTLLVKPDHRAPVIVSMVWYKVGSAYEYRGITGISHVLEHMMFKGTKKYGPGVVAKMVAVNGGRENAFTSSDYTAYFQELSADKLPLSFKIEADRMHNLLLNNKEFTKELQVVKEERYMRTDDNPQSLTYERFAAAAYLDNPYHNPVIGWPDDLKNMTVEDVRSWYHHHYGPNNAIVVVVGDVQPSHVHNLAKKYFGKLRAIKVPKFKPVSTAAALGTRHVDVRIPAKLPWVIIGYNVPVAKSDTAKWEPYALDVLAGILDSGNSARLAREIVRGKQIASEAGAAYNPFALLPTTFILEGTPAHGHTILQVKNALLNQVKQLQTNLVLPRELNRIKAQVVAQKTYSKDSLMGQAMQIGSLASVGLPWQLGDDYVKHIEAVTPQQILAVAKKYLTANRMTVAILHPLPIGSHQPFNRPNMNKGVNNHVH